MKDKARIEYATPGCRASAPYRLAPPPTSDANVFHHLEQR
ncbi:hypothetical protein GCM10009038_03590 [Salinicola rhizosphaerae]|uniref:Uncharacterized protein n=1 Tax=Salinicola rhizosphaerae TaxID=1443141 RepID=A0ABQ3DPR5_9GAMM|nr:hypothetical protein GCM10009038_03590 [Salinicola rhizosphaerae]